MIEEVGIDSLLKVFITNLAYHVLTKYYIFCEQLYIQKEGPAVVTRIAPNCAMIFMHYLETKFLDTTLKKLKLWLRFIEDTFMIWQPGENQLNSFPEEPIIKFIRTKHKDEISFLDT